jgi:TonB family protein
VAHEKKNKPPAPTVSEAPSGGAQDEFENAVTTAIPGVMVQAFDHNLANGETDDVEVIGTNLVASPLPPAEDELLTPGSVLKDRFEIVGVVHTSNMSCVYKAIDRRRHVDGSGQVHVAIKMMRPAIASGQDARLKLEREAARAQRLAHPNVVNVFDFDEHKGRFFLVMEWLEGETVLSLLKRTIGRQLDRAFAWQIIEGTAAGVQHAHLNNIVHADINPGNIFITVTHEIKLLDFGVARNWADQFDPHEERLLWAAKAYASPDVLSGIAPVIEDDVFSLGCVAYRLLGGAHPFQDSDVLKAMRDEFEPVPVPGLPENEWQVIQRALAYDRSDRPKSAAVFFRNTLQLAPMDLDMGSGNRQTWRWLATTIAALALIAAGFWWLRDNPAVLAPEVSTETTAESVNELQAVPPKEVDDTPVRGLLEAAESAMADARVIEPADDSARGYYRDVLAIEPGNPVALRGLRTISDRYVQQAESLLRSGSPLDSSAALEIAADSDPANPAIEIVQQLLASEGNQQLADARGAALSGDLEQAAALLDNARQYPAVDAAAIASVDALIAERGNEAVLLGQLERAEERIAAGQLIAPAGNSARDIVLSLRRRHGGDARLEATTNRLGERLLTNAAFATAAGEYRSAGELLDGVESLGILENEVATARAALVSAEAQPADAPAGAAVAAAATGAAAAGSIEAGPDTDVTNDTTATDEVSESSARAGGSSEPASDSSTSEPETRRRSLSDLGITEYVAPKYPRSAQRRNLSGFVEVEFVVNTDGSTGEFGIVNAMPNKIFDASAEKAVSRWKFTPRDEPVNARIVLSFEATP